MQNIIVTEEILNNSKEKFKARYHSWKNENAYDVKLLLEKINYVKSI